MPLRRATPWGALIVYIGAVLPDLGIQRRAMKLVYGLISYLAGASALIALGIGAISLLISPDETSAAKVKAETSGAAPAETIATTAIDPHDRNHVPIWIAPTPKYSYAAPDNAEQAGKLARGRKPEGRYSDWRLRERYRNGEGAGSALGYTTDARTRRQTADQLYHEPIQFREKTEPR